jgi:hypothetical protein
MKTTVKQLAFAASVLFALVIIFSSFKPAKRNSIANGGGIADGIYFSFNVLEQKDGVVIGQIQYGDNTYAVTCAKWFGTSAVLFTSDGHAFYVCDNKGAVTDWISDPIGAECGTLISSADFYGLHFVNIGNIQVKE